MFLEKMLDTNTKKWLWNSIYEEKKDECSFKNIFQKYLNIIRINVFIITEKNPLWNGSELKYHYYSTP